MNPFILSLALFAVAPFQSVNVPPAAKLKLPATAAPGSTVKASVTIKFAEGLHAYQNPPAKDYMIPVQVVSGTKGFTIKIAYPKGQAEKVAGEDQAVPVYAGEVKFPFEFKAPSKAGIYKFDLIVKYQQCNESGCFPPGEVKIAGSVMIKK